MRPGWATPQKVLPEEPENNTSFVRDERDNQSPVDFNLTTIDLSFDLYEVNDALFRPRSGKAAGPDGVPIDLFKSMPDLWGPLVTNVLRCHVGLQRTLLRIKLLSCPTVMPSPIDHLTFRMLHITMPRANLAEAAYIT
ncbi:hypothetical protein NDU88_006237 [Pleurodeles waltl]|uniref:Uncharacterized protein n=1 Tax=Pleurodeles waltl TaxID=8319 RepID=A0AAV7TXQ6_PLEWA|nr:hypothetical protein NDU88_006237 [Pleurodeles waltl]